MWSRLANVCVAAALFPAAYGAALRVSDFTTGDELFADGAVTHLRIEAPATELQVLRSFAFSRETPQEERPSARCTVGDGTNTWTNVAIHLKGSAGSFRSVDDSPSFTLNFSKYVSRQRFHGLEKISLNTSVQDPTRISEKLCREIYRQGGIPVPRAGYATAELNGRRLGFYVLLEGWDREFMQRHFADARGPLYEGRFLTDIDQPLIVAYGSTNKTLSVARLLAAAREPNPPRRMAQLEAALDMDRFTRLLALDSLIWNGDGYAFHANNYRIFFDRRQQRFVFLAHGLDQMLGIPDAPVLAGGDGLVAWAVLSLPDGRQRVLERIREFRSSFFQPQTIRTRALTIASAVSSAMAREAGSSGSTPEPSPAVLDWLQRLTERVASIDQQLAGISNLATIRTGQSIVPANWINRTLSGAPLFLPPTNSSSLGIRTSPGANGAWVTVLWIEHGRYRLQGNVRRIPGTGATNQLACGFRVRAPRKRSLTVDWGWDGRRRVADDERFNLAYQPLPSNAGTNWIELNCEIDLRQPIADLELLCEASGNGEAFFDLPSLKLTRLTDPGRD